MYNLKESNHFIQADIIAHAEDRQAFNDAFGPPKPPAFMADMSKFVHLKKTAPKPSSSILKERKFLSSDPIDFAPTYQTCKCTGSGSVVSAEKCLTDGSKCVPCSNEIARDICGYKEYVYGQCMPEQDCGSGKQSVKVCFRFFDDTRNTAENECTDLEDQACTTPCYGECQCSSSTSEIKAEKCSLTDPSQELLNFSFRNLFLTCVETITLW